MKKFNGFVHSRIYFMVFLPLLLIIFIFPLVRTTAAGFANTSIQHLSIPPAAILTTQRTIYDADIILTGIVEESWYGINDSNGIIYTFTKVKVNQVIKGIGIEPEVVFEYLTDVVNQGQPQMISSSSISKLNNGDHIIVFIQISNGIFYLNQSYVIDPFNNSILGTSLSITKFINTIHNYSQGQPIPSDLFISDISPSSLNSPSIGNVVPNISAGGIGAKVTIYGSGFGATQEFGSKVYFFWRQLQNQPAEWTSAPVQSWSDTSIVVDVPAEASSGSVWVTNLSGNSNQVNFTVSYSYSGHSWEAANLPVHYWINPSQIPQGTTGITAIQDAMNTWSNVSTQRFSFYYDGLSTSYGPGNHDGKSVIGMGTIPAPDNEDPALNLCWPETGGLLECDIIINSIYSWGIGEGGKYDIQNVITHEAGHFLMLKDLYGDPDIDKTMYGYTWPAETKKRTLADDDIAGIRYIYPVIVPTSTPTATPNPTVTPTPTPTPPTPNDGVQLCDGTNYGVPCVMYNYVNNDYCTNLAISGMDNKVESLRFRGSYIGNYEIILYGDNSCQVYNARNGTDDNDLEGLNNQISSFRMEINTQPPNPGDGVELCDGTNYGTPCSNLYTSPGNDVCINLRDTGWDNRAESLRFKGSYIGNYDVILYHDNSCQIYNARPGQDTTTLGPFNNQIASIRIEKHGPPPPDLIPYPRAGRSFPIVMSSVQGTTGARLLYAGSEAYTDWGIKNTSSSNAGSFFVDITIDDQVVLHYPVSSLAAGQTLGFDDWSIIWNTSGWHTVKIIVDPTNSVGETDENNNTFEMSIRWDQLIGWKGDYYNNSTLIGGPPDTRDDFELRFDWGLSSPIPGVIPTDNFSIKWIRDINLPSGNYRFHLGHDDGARFSVDGNTIIDAWGTCCTEDIAETYISEGKHRFIVTYFDQTGAANIDFWWEKLEIKGWKGEYYNNYTLSGHPILVRDDEVIDFAWSSGSPDIVVVSDNFSARWTRSIQLPTGKYRFRVWHDDGVRLYIDNILVLDNWCSGCRLSEYVDQDLANGSHSITLEMYDSGGGSDIQLNLEQLDISAWKGEYFNNTSLSNSPILIRSDQTLNFDWYEQSPSPFVRADNFSARWTRSINFSDAEYTFYIKQDDGARLYIDGNLVFDNWCSGCREVSQITIPMTSGEHQLILEMVENSGWASAGLWWDYANSNGRIYLPFTTK